MVCCIGVSLLLDKSEAEGLECLVLSYLRVSGGCAGLILGTNNTCPYRLVDTALAASLSNICEIASLYFKPGMPEAFMIFLQ